MDIYRGKGKGAARHAMKACGEVEVELNSILNSDLDAGEWQIYVPVNLRAS
jgi:hypothetical protein